ncbi:hypothetical protein CSHISOI_04490 [Colletotrichum shisoi]|uniref:Uncharacterized protein n=1 Tax=Colletotrichum shisoi TaxID=2078593 RepID=A0A5Q4BV88_9PEZI|nr:hypothetical protein CSHISOI_04490 [Colletotrichum shisoi]
MAVRTPRLDTKMPHPQDRKHNHMLFHVDPADYQHGNYSPQRSPQYKLSNESASSLAQGHDPLADSGDEESFAVISLSEEATTSGALSETTGSDDTVVDPTTARRAAGTSAVLGSALTQDNIHLHDRVYPLGSLSTYQWVWGQPCLGGFDIKDTSSNESMKVHVSRSRVSQATENLDSEYGVVNHPSEAYIAFAGDWADVAADPSMMEELDRLE